VCPECGKDTIIKGKAEYGGGWICYAKKGGCGAKWPDDSEQARTFETTEIGRVDNPDLADTFNTVLKMADKRALIAAVLNGTAASDVFTQDVEDSQPSASAEPQPQAERRENAPKPLAAPKSWAKLTEMVAAYDQATHDTFFAFADACRRYLFPDSTDTKSLSKGDRDVLFQKCAGAALRLREAFEPTELPPPNIEDIRHAFFFVTNVELAIPDEALDAEGTEAAERDA
jgi:hypothetical protein